MADAAIYLRVSSEDQLRGLSLPVQRQRCAERAEAAGHTVVRVYADEGKSAFHDDIRKRPAMQELLADAQRGLFQVVYVYMYDRLARNLKVYHTIFADLRACGAEPLSATESADWLAQGISGLMAEAYSRALSKRLTDARRAEVLRGRWLAVAPFGYQRTAEDRLAPTEQGALVTWIFAEFATDRYSIMAMVDTLNAAGHQHQCPSHHGGKPRAFGMSTLRHLLRNRAYLGETRCGDLAVPGAHPALTDPATFDAVQAILDRRKQHGGRQAIVAPDRGICCGVLGCAMCGAPLWYQKSVNPRGTVTRQYACRDRVHYHRCAEPRAMADTIDTTLLGWLQAFELPSDWREQAVVLLHEAEAPTAADAAKAQRDHALRQLKARFLDEAISASEYERQRAALLATSPAPTLRDVVDIDRAAALLHTLPTLIADATNDERRALIRAVFERVWVQQRQIVAWTPRRAFLPLFRPLYAKSCGVSPCPTAFPHLWTMERQAA
jgi:site-specific DNA recombinase